MLLTKLSVPVPSVVLLSAVVGFADVDQQTPLAVTGPPPSAEIDPPQTAELGFIEVTALVVNVASTTGLVVKFTSLP